MKLSFAALSLVALLLPSVPVAGSSLRASAAAALPDAAEEDKQPARKLWGGISNPLKAAQEAAAKAAAQAAAAAAAAAAEVLAQQRAPIVSGIDLTPTSLQASFQTMLETVIDQELPKYDPYTYTHEFSIPFVDQPCICGAAGIFNGAKGTYTGEIKFTVTSVYDFSQGATLSSLSYTNSGVNVYWDNSSYDHLMWRGDFSVGMTIPKVTADVTGTATGILCAGTAEETDVEALIKMFNNNDANVAGTVSVTNGGISADIYQRGKNNPWNQMTHIWRNDVNSMTFTLGEVSSVSFPDIGNTLINVLTDGAYTDMSVYAQEHFSQEMTTDVEAVITGVINDATANGIQVANNFLF